MVKIVALLGRNGGDNSNAMGVQAALAERYEAAGINVERELSDDEIFGNLSPDEHYIFIAAGRDMIKALATYKHPNALTVWGGHEPPEALLLDAPKLDVIQLPEYTLNNVYRIALRNKLMATPQGVPHALTPAMVEESYRSDSQKRALFMLGNAAGSPLLSPEKAKEIGVSLGRHAMREGFTLIGTSDPRMSQAAVIQNAFLEGIRESSLPAQQLQFYPDAGHEDTPRIVTDWARTLLNYPHGVFMSEDDLRLVAEDSNYLNISVLPHIPQAEKYALVTLGGDADGRIFSPGEAKILGQQAGQRAVNEGLMLLGTSSPRTGGKENHKPGMPLDAVSRAFLEGVRESGLPEGQMKFYPYYDDHKPSTLPAMIGAVREKPGSFALMPGDSATMITQAVDLLPIGAAEVYETAAMGENHHKQVSYLLKQALISKWQKSTRTLGQKPKPAAEMVADKVIEQARGMRFPIPPMEANRGRAYS